MHFLLKSLSLCSLFELNLKIICLSMWPLYLRSMAMTPIQRPEMYIIGAQPLCSQLSGLSQVEIRTVQILDLPQGSGCCSYCQGGGTYLCCSYAVCRVRGSCASSTRITWCTLEMEPKQASRSASTSSDRGGGTAAQWTTPQCSDAWCRLVSWPGTLL